MKFQAPKGTADVLPSDQPMRGRVIQTLQQAARHAGYGPITVPTFEETSLFARAAGDGSDVVQKEMYTFKDSGGRSLTLRPEATAQVVRAYIEHGMHRSPLPFKVEYTAPMFRYAAPQKGRFREFWQVGVEAIGSDDPAVDVELISIAVRAFASLGLTGIRLKINSIGCSKCRTDYLKKLTIFFNDFDAKLDEGLRAKAQLSPLRMFDSNNPSVVKLLEGAPLINDHLCEECHEHFVEVSRLLVALGIDFDLAPRLVRGLDYYTRTVFEFVDVELDAAQSTICAGGRYDGLVAELGGKVTPASGLAAGIERIVLSCKQRGLIDDYSPTIDVFFAFTEGVDRQETLVLLNDLRSIWKCEIDYAHRSLKGQITQASRLGARVVAVVEQDKVILRVREGNDITVNDLQKVPEKLKEILQ